LVSLALSAGFVALSLRGTDLRTVVQQMLSADPRPLLGYLALLLCIHLVRTVRWGLLLRPVGRVSFFRLNTATAVGYMLLMVLPLRLGEFARPLLVSRPQRGDGPILSRSGALGSCVVERIIDGLAIGVLGIIALQALGNRATGPTAHFAKNAVWLVTSGFAALCVAMLGVVVLRERAVALVRKGVGLLSVRLADRAGAMLGMFIGALRVGSGAQLALVLLLTVFHWGLHVVGFTWVASAFSIPLSPLQAGAVLAVQVVGVMVPAGPGMLGTSQFFAQLGVSMFVPGTFDVPSTAARAAAFANAMWLLQLGQQLALGIVFMLVGGVSLSATIGRAVSAPQAAEGLVDQGS
jgi:uncharacterized protein (TIRG00374 family)